MIREVFIAKTCDEFRSESGYLIENWESERWPNILSQHHQFVLAYSWFYHVDIEERTCHCWRNNIFHTLKRDDWSVFWEEWKVIGYEKWFKLYIFSFERRKNVIFGGFKSNICEELIFYYSKNTKNNANEKFAWSAQNLEWLWSRGS